MARYVAIRECYVLGVQLIGGQEIELSEENEQTLKLGKHAVETDDPRRPGKKIKTSFSHLRKVDNTKLDPTAAVDGMVVHPPAKALNLISAAGPQSI